MAKRWTRDEDRYLKRFYPTKGPDHVAKQLGRPRRGVLSRAQRLGLLSGCPKGYVPLCWVAPRGRGDAFLKQAGIAAKRDGVLRRQEDRYVKNIVPEWWADKFAEELGEKKRQAERTRSWLRTRDLARMLHRDSDTLLRSVDEGHAFGRYLKDVQRVLVHFPSRHYKWHPQQARMAINRWRAARRAA